MTTKTVTWPYTVELISLKSLLVDLTYQRPTQTVFVEKLVAEFDPTLVGTLDVSQRTHHSEYAILDGSQRFAAIQKFPYTDVWCSVYVGMSLSDEAMFFYRKNRNRRSVHPYYQIRALIATGHKQSIEINRIVESEGFKLGIGARQENVLSAIRALEETYQMSSLQRNEPLSAVLNTIRRVYQGRDGGKEGKLVKGMGRFFQAYADDELDFEWLYSKLLDIDPRLLVGRAEDKTVTSRHPSAYHIAHDMVEMYN
ncbi:MAG TPA: DUF6551 family protein, partial [Ktedonobacteraceae bacterium]